MYILLVKKSQTQGYSLQGEKSETFWEYYIYEYLAYSEFHKKIQHNYQAL